MLFTIITVVSVVSVRWILIREWRFVHLLVAVVFVNRQWEDRWSLIRQKTWALIVCVFRKLNLTFVLVNRKCQLVFLTFWLAVSALSEASAKQISCESESMVTWTGVGELKTCWMTLLTKIDSIETSIIPDAEVGGLIFGGNRNISFLPVELAISFPELKVFESWGCSIKTIVKAHFKDLRFLVYLYLQRNQIDTISSDTFEDLSSLELLNLRKKIF